MGELSAVIGGASVISTSSGLTEQVCLMSSVVLTTAVGDGSEKSIGSSQ